MTNTIEHSATIGSKSGLHARPAAIFVQKARGFQCQLTLVKNGKTANAKSILSVLSLGAKQGEEITLQADGDDAEAALETLVPLLGNDLG